jgi:hypothetical protein
VPVHQEHNRAGLQEETLGITLEQFPVRVNAQKNRGDYPILVCQASLQKKELLTGTSPESEEMPFLLCVEVRPAPCLCVLCFPGSWSPGSNPDFRGPGPGPKALEPTRAWCQRIPAGIRGGCRFPRRPCREVLWLQPASGHWAPESLIRNVPVDLGEAPEHTPGFAPSRTPSTPGC